MESDWTHEFDPKEYANWLVSRGVPEQKLICPMCDSNEILRAVRPAVLYHLDTKGNLDIDPATGQPTGVQAVPIACMNCGFLRLFAYPVDALPLAG